MKFDRNRDSLAHFLERFPNGDASWQVRQGSTERRFALLDYDNQKGDHFAPRHGDTAGIGEAMPPTQPTSMTATNATSKERNSRQPLHMDNVKDKRKQSDADPGKKPGVAADIVRCDNCSQPQNQEDDEQNREQKGLLTR